MVHAEYLDLLPLAKIRTEHLTPAEIKSLATDIIDPSSFLAGQLGTAINQLKTMTGIQSIKLQVFLTY